MNMSVTAGRLIVINVQRRAWKGLAELSKVSSAEEREELQRVLSSSQFRRALKLQRFLNVTCSYHFKNRSEEITEFVVASEAFGKGQDFDPTQDSLVRVQAREVRRRLRDYYQNEGKDSHVVLEYPVGHYAPVFTARADHAGPVLQHTATPLSNTVSLSSLLARRVGLTMAVTVALGALVVFAVDRELRDLLGVSRSASAKDNALSPQVRSLWDRFLQSETQTLLVLSNPDTESCPDPVPLSEAAGGTCKGQYTGIGEAVALHLITELFKGAKMPLLVKQSRMVDADDSKRYNLILLGGKKVNLWTARLGEDLSLDAGGKEIEGLAEAAQFQTVYDPKTQQVTKDRALIAVRRHPTAGHWIMVLYGKYTQGTYAAAEATTDEHFLARLNWPGLVKPFPETFRVLLGVNVNNGIPEGPIPVAVRVP